MQQQITQKSERLNIRLSPQQKDLIFKAADTQNSTASDFVLEKACEAAHEVLALESHFTLPEEQWNAFCKALDAPPQDIHALRKLLAERGIFDGQ
ncbi:MAG: DUF1778 domain-containing protein [SAR324 cluster bacterium]|nr:DUF1778 domain-containing protein [SAR324 cluster bacterium]